MFLQRTELLIGSDNIEKLKNSNVIVFGLGGVGGATVEALVRAGIGNLSIVDFDIVDKTNLNRQIIATHTVIGKTKVEVARDRILSINPDINLTVYNEKLLKDNIALFFKDKKYDYIVDAIDLVSSKLALIEFATTSKIPIICCMGTGNKLNPEKLKITDIKKTSVCPLAKIIRKELKKRRINKLKVVFSDETPRKSLNLDVECEKTKNVGSISFVPPVAGMLLASQVIKDICKL
ncbi:tRNA threonylcarbamoyladenosine dehydratase [Fusobacterium nucleatum]|uniref:tRNA threonylcarbamoyladenosine dehydratase n=1 Tax=Fusobacterium nucleatum TaxID=851 RepID=UPI003D02B575